MSGHSSAPLPDSSSSRLLSDCSAEPTGAYFDRGGKTMYIHVQHAGGPQGNDLLVAITRDWGGSH